MYTTVKRYGRAKFVYTLSVNGSHTSLMLALMF